MDKSWMQLGNRLLPAYVNGVKVFVKFSIDHMDNGNTILCPCYKCNNCCWLTPDQVHDNLIIHGIVRVYDPWVYHGEMSKPSKVDETLVGDIDDAVDDGFEKRRRTNKQNREAPTTNHCAGTKSFARIIHDSKTQEDQELEHEFDRYELWKKTHYSEKKNKWVDERSKEIYEQLLSMRESNELTTNEIFDKILPPKSGYIRGMGVGPKPKTCRSRQQAAKLEKEIEESKRREKEARERAEEARERAEETLKKNEALEARLAVMEKKIMSMFAEMEERFQSFERLMCLTPGWDNSQWTNWRRLFFSME